MATKSRGRAKAPDDLHTDFIDTDTVPAGGTDWPLYVVAAAVVLTLTDGGLGVRVFHSYGLAPTPDAARSMMLSNLSLLTVPYVVIDLSVLPVEREALLRALNVADMPGGRA